MNNEEKCYMNKKMNLICCSFFMILLAFPKALFGDRDVILEFKAAAFLPTGCIFKGIYGCASALFGPELTFQFSEDGCWYGFASVDFLSKNGFTIGLGTPTKVSLTPLAFGVKYFIPTDVVFDCINNNIDFYLGFGLEPINVRVRNCDSFVNASISKWGVGGIFKAGAYIDISCDLVLDLFIDYSVAHIGAPCFCLPQGMVPQKPQVNGVIIGGGLGCRF